MPWTAFHRVMWSRVQALTARIWPSISSFITHPTVITMVAIAGLAYWIGLRPATDTSSDYLPKRWNESIERLGITPVYPPQEDIYVGDLILQVVASGHKFPKLPDTLSTNSEAFVGKYIKIGQLENMKQYFALPTFAPNFGDSEWSNGELALMQPRLEKVAIAENAGKLSMTDVLFPVIEITKDKAATAISDWFSFGAASDLKEELILKGVQTYSMNPLHAFWALTNFCQDAASYCDDKYIRDILSYTLNRDILLKSCTTAGTLRYIYDVKLLVVRQVYTARGLEMKNQRSSSSFGSGARQVQNTDDTNDGKDSPPGSAATNGTPSEATKENSKGPVGPEANTVRTKSNSSLFTAGKFGRPLVIGFNAVSVGMRNSSPAWLENNIGLSPESPKPIESPEEDKACQS